MTKRNTSAAPSRNVRSRVTIDPNDDGVNVPGIDVIVGIGCVRNKIKGHPVAWVADTGKGVTCSTTWLKDEDGKKKEYHFPCIDEDDDGYAYTLLATLKNQVFGKLSAQNQEIIGSVTEMKLFKVDTEVFDDSFFFIVHSVINNILLSLLGAKHGGSLCAHGN